MNERPWHDRQDAGRGGLPSPSSQDWGDEARRAEVLALVGDPHVVTLLSQLLGELSMSVRSASDPAAARAALAERLPDALVLDLPPEPGATHGLIDLIRRLPGGHDVVIIALSGRDSFLGQTEVIHAGADACFGPPYDWEAIALKLHALLDHGGVNPPRILTVEDDPTQAAFARAVLEAAGYHVRVCADPRDFGDEFAAFGPDLILMDIMLPGIDGYDLARYVRQSEHNATLPIVFLTSHGELHARIKTARAGGDDHLLKPVHPSLLVSTVAGRLERARLLRLLLNRDGLTRLYTHTCFVEQAERVLARRRRDGGHASLVMVDLDHFKLVNDTYGHQAGDRVLVALATLLRHRVQRTDVVGRYGGEEFAMVLDDLDARSAASLVTGLLADFGARAHRAPDGRTFTATFSAGIAPLDERAGSLEGWIRDADGALYVAKHRGRSEIVVHDGERPGAEPQQVA